MGVIRQELAVPVITLDGDGDKNQPFKVRVIVRPNLSAAHPDRSPVEGRRQFADTLLTHMHLGLIRCEHYL